MRENFKFFTFALSLVICLAASALGQETAGEIQGTVKDQSGAVVPNVTVVIKGVSLGFNRTMQTDDRGSYRARQIPPGTYTVSTEASSGFAAQVIEGVQVAIGNVTTVDISTPRQRPRQIFQPVKLMPFRKEPDLPVC